MAWPAEWKRAHLERRPAVHRIRTLGIAGPESVSSAGDWTITEDTATGTAGPIAISAAAGTSAGTRVTMGDWRSTSGAWSVRLTGDASGLRRLMWRGQPVVHEVRHPGHSEWVAVQVGRVHDISSPRRGEWLLTVRDLIGGLKSRYDRLSSRWALFAGLESAKYTEWGTFYTEIAANYGTSDTVIRLNRYTADAADAAELAALYGFGVPTGGRGVVVMRPDDEERRFYRTYTGVALDAGQWTLTGVSTATTQWRTGKTATPSGTRIQPAVLLAGWPGDIVAQILTSTGTGTNGPDDVLPATWGYGLPPELVDRADIDLWIAALHAGNVLQWNMIVEIEQPDGLEWLQGVLARAGLYLAMRQGRITVRGAIDVYGAPSAGGTLSYGVLSEVDLEGDPEWSEWTGGVGEEAYRLVVDILGGEYRYSLVDLLRSHPSGPDVEVSLIDWLQTEVVGAYAMDDAPRTANRLATWALRLAGELIVSTRHPLAAGLAVGDPIDLDVGVTDGWYDPVGLRGRRGIVTSVDPDWWGEGPTRISVAVPPPDLPAAVEDEDALPEVE